MSIPLPIIIGTGIYAAVAVGLILLAYVARLSGQLSKENLGIANIVISIATFASWLFWLCAWMHQWHPLIKPVYE